MADLFGQLCAAARTKGLEVGLVAGDLLGKAGKEYREIVSVRVTHRDKPKGPVVEEQACTLATLDSAAADLLLVI